MDHKFSKLIFYIFGFITGLLWQRLVSINMDSTDHTKLQNTEDTVMKKIENRKSTSVSTMAVQTDDQDPEKYCGTTDLSIGQYKMFTNEDSMTFVYKFGSLDLPDYISILLESIKYDIFFVPQSNILCDILKNGKSKTSTYTQAFFNLKIIKVYNALCTFLYIRREFIILNLLCTVDFSLLEKHDEFEVDLESLIERYTEYYNTNKISYEDVMKSFSWLVSLYTPVTPQKVFDYKMCGKCDSTKYLDSAVMQELNNVIILQTKSGLTISILEYIIFTIENVGAMYP